MTPDTSGPEWRTPFALYDPDESCWRTSQATFLSGSDLYSATWPPSGMTRAGCAYELPTPALPTAEPASSSLLPTPVVNDMGEGKTVEAWDDWTERMKAAHGNGNGHGPSLSIEMQRLLPTPGCAGGGKKIPEDAVWSGKAAYKVTGEKVQVHIDQIAVLLATPNARDYKGSPSAAWSGQASLPRDAERLSRGEPTRQPSDAGSASRDAQRPGQLSLDEPPSD